jgi:hypothetical protein
MLYEVKSLLWHMLVMLPRDTSSSRCQSNPNPAPSPRILYQMVPNASGCVIQQQPNSDHVKSSEVRELSPYPASTHQPIHPHLR